MNGRRPAFHDGYLRLRIGEYLFDHMLIALTAPDPVVRRALSWLSRHNADIVSQRDLHRGPLNKRGTAADAAELAQALVKLEALHLIPAAEPTGGRPKGPRYQVNPHLRGAR